MPQQPRTGGDGLRQLGDRSDVPTHCWPRPKVTHTGRTPWRPQKGLIPHKDDFSITQGMREHIYIVTTLSRIRWSQTSRHQRRSRLHTSLALRTVRARTRLDAHS